MFEKDRKTDRRNFFNLRPRTYGDEIENSSVFLSLWLKITTNSCTYQKKTVPLQRKGQNTLAFSIKIAAMKTSNTPQEMPFGSESGSISNVQKKYYTADEAVAFLEPRIRAMFK